MMLPACMDTFSVGRLGGQGIGVASRDYGGPTGDTARGAGPGDGCFAHHAGCPLSRGLSVGAGRGPVGLGIRHNRFRHGQPRGDRLVRPGAQRGAQDQQAGGAVKGDAALREPGVKNPLLNVRSKRTRGQSETTGFRRPSSSGSTTTISLLIFPSLTNNIRR